MAYAIVLIKSDSDWEALSETERDFASIVRWWTELRSKGLIGAGAQLGPPRTATTISFTGTQPLVTDGAYVEAKESVGGFGILNVETRDEAIAIAQSWPSKCGIRIELRPIVEG
jgi:hypothetical protein